MSIKIIALFSVLLLNACGFSPMYGANSGANNISAKQGFSQIAISNIPDRSGQFLRNTLIDRFYSRGVPSNPSYQLVIKEINESITNFDLTLDSSATRRQLRLSLTMTLVDLETKEVVLTRALLATTSHNVLESEFSTLVTEQNSREAALNDLARQIERQLALYFTR